MDPLLALTQVSTLLNLSLALEGAAIKLENSDLVLEDAPQFTSAKQSTPLYGTYTISGTQGAHQAPKVKLAYLQSGQGLDLVWRVETDVLDTWTLSYVDARTAENLLGVVDYAAHARYMV